MEEPWTSQKWKNKKAMKIRKNFHLPKHPNLQNKEVVGLLIPIQKSMTYFEKGLIVRPCLMVPLKVPAPDIARPLRIKLIGLQSVKDTKSLQNLKARKPSNIM